MTHAWCRDPSRDERVRAAEDGRTSPQPTLEECIETAFSAGVRDSFRKVEEAWAMIPKSVSASSPVDQENKGDGMRTERVTLEVTYRWLIPPSKWNWNHVITSPMVTLKPGESVRVVSDEEREAALPDVSDQDGDRVAIDWPGLAKVLQAERDAALRERDEARKSWLRSEESGTRLLAERNAALDAADGLRKRVAEREAASGGGEPVAWMCEWTDHAELYGSKIQAERAAAGDVVPQPLYRSPPQPRGWLTGEEREALEWWCGKNCPVSHGQVDAWRGALRNLLARSTPPKVRLPLADLGDRLLRDGVIDALAAAGVEVAQ